MKNCDVMSETTSKCTALVTQQVYRQIHTFFEEEVIVTLTCKGPAKSTPTKEKDRALLKVVGELVVDSMPCPDTDHTPM